MSSLPEHKERESQKVEVIQKLLNYILKSELGFTQSNFQAQFMKVQCSAVLCFEVLKISFAYKMGFWRPNANSRECIAFFETNPIFLVFKKCFQLCLEELGSGLENLSFVKLLCS
jgi:hypothetical protein